MLLANMAEKKTSSRLSEGPCLKGIRKTVSEQATCHPPDLCTFGCAHTHSEPNPKTEMAGLQDSPPLSRRSKPLTTENDLLKHVLPQARQAKARDVPSKLVSYLPTPKSFYSLSRKCAQAWNLWAKRELKWEVYLSNSWLCLKEPAAHGRQVPDPESRHCQTLKILTPSAVLCASPDPWLSVSATDSCCSAPGASSVCGNVPAQLPSIENQGREFENRGLSLEHPLKTGHPPPVPSYIFCNETFLIS